MTTINQTIQKGITHTKINNLINITQQEINQKNKELLQPLIKDEDILKIMLQEQNLQKIKNRIETKITIKDNKNETLLTANKIGQTLQTTKNELNTIQKGNTIGTSPDPIKQKLQFLDWQNIWVSQSGLVEKIEVNLIFRKAQ